MISTSIYSKVFADLARSCLRHTAPIELEVRILVTRLCVRTAGPTCTDPWLPVLPRARAREDEGNSRSARSSKANYRSTSDIDDDLARLAQAATFAVLAAPICCLSACDCAALGPGETAPRVTAGDTSARPALVDVPSFFRIPTPASSFPSSLPPSRLFARVNSLLPAANTMALAGLGRLVSTRRGLIAVAMALATVYTLTLRDATALTGPPRAASISPSTGAVAGKLREKWSWGTGGGIMGDLSNGGDALPPVPAPQALEVEALPRQNYRAEDDPILAIPGAVDPNVQPAKLVNHRARPFGRTTEDVTLKPADRAAVEEAKVNAGMYSPHEMARLEADLAEAQAPASKKKAAVAPAGVKKPAAEAKKGVKEQHTAAADTATVATVSALEAGGGGAVDEQAGSAISTPGEDGLEDAPSVAARKGAADAAPMAALVLPGAKGKDAAVMPKDIEQAIATQADAAAAAATTVAPASHAAAKAASSDADSVQERQDPPPPPSEKIRQQAGSPKAEDKLLVAEQAGSAVPDSDVVAPAGKKPKIGTGRRVVKPLPGADSAQKPAMPPHVGGGEKAGKIVKQEAGKRVGTGARPGAKGMGMRRLRFAKRT